MEERLYAAMECRALGIARKAAPTSELALRPRRSRRLGALGTVEPLAITAGGLAGDFPKNAVELRE